MNTMYLFNIQLHAAVQVNVLLEAHYAGTIMLALEIYGRLGNKTWNYLTKFVHFKCIGKLKKKKKTPHKINSDTPQVKGHLVL